MSETNTPLVERLFQHYTNKWQPKSKDRYALQILAPAPEPRGLTRHAEDF